MEILIEKFDFIEEIIEKIFVRKKKLKKCFSAKKFPRGEIGVVKHLTSISVTILGAKKCHFLT